MVNGLIRKIISFNTIPIAEVEVFEVNENFSWVLIKEVYRNKIKKGQVVFSQPEKGNWFF